MKFLTLILFGLVSFKAQGLDYGIDRLQEAWVSEKLQGKNLAVLTHAAGKSQNGVHLIDELHHHFKLKKIFSPEHGLRTEADDWVEDGVDVTTGLPVISLYKNPTRAPTLKDLEDIEAIVIDLQDVGMRYYTYFATIAAVMKVSAPLKIEVILLDRPNLLGGIIMEGQVLEAALAEHFTAYHTVPTRHGMTLGELALMINQEKKMGCLLTVIPVLGWKRESLLSKLDRPWIAPSPALINIEQVGLYALWGGLENLDLAVGRGITNELAFRVIGAPWISPVESEHLAFELNQLGLGAQFSPSSWQVSRVTHQGKKVHGVMLTWKGEEIRTDEMTYQVILVLMKMFPAHLSVGQIPLQILGSKAMALALQQRVPWTTYQKIIEAELEQFKLRREPFLLYSL